MATTEELLALARDRLARGRRFDVRLPYGPMDWTVLTCCSRKTRWCTAERCCTLSDRAVAA
jgi:hypothetical protein